MLPMNGDQSIFILLPNSVFHSLCRVRLAVHAADGYRQSGGEYG